MQDIINKQLKSADFFVYYLPLLPMKALLSLKVEVFSLFKDPSLLLLNPLLKFCGGLGGSGLPNPALSRRGNDPAKTNISIYKNLH